MFPKEVLLWLEVLEHLGREEGKELLRKMEGIARKQVVLSTPVGNYKQESYDGNPHQELKYTWSPKEMKARGYKVSGVGLRNLGGKAGIQSPFPGLAGDMVCTKKIGK